MALPTLEGSSLSIRDIVSKVKHLEIHARKLVTNHLQSEYRSVFKGQGMEFDEVRPYSPEDDIRDIDWNVTARMGEPYIKTFIEERQLTVNFALDISASSLFGGQRSKREVMAEIVALLGFVSLFNHDQVGLLCFSTHVEKVVRPNLGVSHLLRLIRDAEMHPPQEKGTNLAESFREMGNLLRKRSILFILSDFLDSDYEKPLGALAKKHDVVPMLLIDPLEKKWPLLPRFRLPIFLDLEDMENGKRETIDITSHSHASISKQAHKIFQRLRLDKVEIHPDTNYVKQIERMLRRRMSARAHG